MIPPKKNRDRMLLLTLVLILAAVLLAYWVLPPGSTWAGGDDEDPVAQMISAENTVYRVPLRVLDVTEGGAFSATGVCLDGTPPAYHMSPGWGSGAKKWLLFLEGGGWCTTLEDCRLRALSPLGSSERMPRWFTFNGILANSSQLNPDFFNWNIVYIKYCDGASFAGTAGEVDFKPEADDTVDAGHPGASQAKLQVQGQDVFRRVVYHLKTDRGMNGASEAVLAGCSAGGLAALLHCDQLAELLEEGQSSTAVQKKGVQVKCLSDGGFFMDTTDAFGGKAMH